VDLPGIDLSWGLERIGGNKRLFLKLLREFAANHRNAIEIIEQRLAEHDFESARRELHTIKGVAGNIGARILQQEAGNLEQLLLKDGRQNVKLPQSFLQAFTTLFNGLSALHVLEKTTGFAADVEDMPAGEGNLDDLLGRLQQMLIEGNPAATTLLGPLQKLLTDEEQLEYLNQVGALLENYEFDYALPILRKIIVKLTGESQ
jgi:polar amino acid transport system substrate-binding protein